MNKLKAKGGNTPFFILNTNLNLILMARKRITSPRLVCSVEKVEPFTSRNILAGKRSPHPEIMIATGDYYHASLNNFGGQPLIPIRIVADRLLTKK